MRNLWIIILFVFFVKINAQENQKFINVTGTSEVIVNADQINISIHIRTIKKSIEESKKGNDKSVNDLVTILTGLGIDPHEIDISPVSMGKNYEYKQGERIQNGYYTNVDLSLLFKNLSKYYELIDKISLNDAYEIVNSNYSVSNFEALSKSAYEKALIAAKEKAEYMAKTMNVKLGDVIEIDETNFSGSPLPVNALAKENFQNSGVSGKVTINRSIRVKFAIM